MNARDWMVRARDTLDARTRVDDDAELLDAHDDVCNALDRLGDLPGLYLEWLADHADRNPQHALLCQRVAGNVRKLAAMQSSDKGARRAVVCRHCGSGDVRADCMATWNVRAQRWDVAGIMDDGHACPDCGREGDVLEEVPA